MVEHPIGSDCHLHLNMIHNAYFFDEPASWAASTSIQSLNSYDLTILSAHWFRISINHLKIPPLPAQIFHPWVSAQL
jgi:hypothetical protein